MTPFAPPKLQVLPPGPWEIEPNLVEFEAHGLACCVMRMSSGQLNGYVRVPPALYGLSFDSLIAVPYGSIHIIGSPVRVSYAYDVIEVHGGITYAHEALGDWWVGFDTAHANDIVPAHEPFPDAEYRDLVYVRAQTTDLARQIKDLLT